jgi:hypothetical protein
MNFLGSYILIPIALLIGQAAPVPRVLLDAAEPIAVATPRFAPLTRPADLPRDFPTKIWVQSNLRETVSRMWAASPTFRRQCLRVQGAGAIQVQLRLDPELAYHPEHRATCELRLYTSGSIIARVRVAPDRITELIAHEMEHVCERLDGIKVEEETRTHRAGYYRINDEQHWSYETDRAIRVGRQVMAEMDIAALLTKAQ